MEAKAGPDGVVRLRQPTPTTITFMANEREAPTEDEGERPPKMKKIRSLAEEEIDTESDEEPLLTKRKRRGVSAQKGQDQPFSLAIGGQARKTGDKGGTGYVDLPNYFGKYGGLPKEKLRARAPRPCQRKTCLSRISHSQSRSWSHERADRRGQHRRVRDWGV
jgi:hypothetical protein